ncbi:hypothetical protein GLYMA_08G142500v4 [Glycine max]|nr:hypothetical protein GLYMA_08G142500v4 [Glycine max]KAH1051184.1 hypothetical protein GYH30_021221 [Glycine max]
MWYVSQPNHQLLRHVFLHAQPQTTTLHDSDNIYDYSSFTPSSFSSVDCNLSLGTPSTCVSEDEEKRSRHECHSVSNFCWDLLQSKHNNPQSHSKSSGTTNTTDPLLARRCANCDTTSTPLWRNAPVALRKEKKEGKKIKKAIPHKGGYSYHQPRRGIVNFPFLS